MEYLLFVYVPYPTSEAEGVVYLKMV